MNTFAIKIIAVVTMLIDHIGVVLFPRDLIFRVIGRVAFPLFVYLIAEGFRHTRSKEKFLLRLFVFALISERFYMMAFESIHFFEFRFSTNNIFYTLFLGGLAILCWDMICEFFKSFIAKCVIFSIVASGILVIAGFLSADYGIYGVVFIFIMYVVKPFWLRMLAMLILCLWQFNWIISALIANQNVSNMHILMIPAGILPILLVICYNGKKGWGWKWFFYLFYPVHLAVLAFLNSIL